MKITDNVRCKNCQYFRRYVGKKKNMGECWKFPPMPSEWDWSVNYRRPEVYADGDWCGFFEEKEK